jgi:hypothetical protein
MRVNLKTIIIAFLGIETLLLCTLPVHGAITQPHNADAMWIEPSYIDLTTRAVGYRFNITLALNISTTHQVGTWQAKVFFDPAYLRAVEAGYTGGTLSEWIMGMPPSAAASPGVPVIDNVLGYVLVGEYLVGLAQPSPGAGTLSWISFNLTGKPSAPTNLVFNITKTYATTDTFVGNDVYVVFTPSDSIAFIPEFPYAMMLSILMTVALTTAVFARKRIQKRSS